MTYAISRRIVTKERLNDKNKRNKGMKGDPLDGTFLFKIDVFQKRSVFNVLIRGAHYGTPSRSPLALCLTFLYISVYLGKFYFSTNVLFLSRVQPARGLAAKSLWESRLTRHLVFTTFVLLFR